MDTERYSERGEEPFYLVLAAELRDGIRTGKYPAGKPMPSLTDLQQRTGLARTTIVKAYRTLKDEGWVRGRQGWGYIAVNPPARGH